MTFSNYLDNVSNREQKALKEEAKTKMYQVAITSAGTEYFFTVDTREDVKTLITQSFRVTGVKVWEDGKELDAYQINTLVFGELTGV